MQTVYLSIQNRKEKKELIAQYEELELYAKTINIHIYCRDLHLLVNEAHLFVKSFQLQDLPYDYYIYENRVRLNHVIYSSYSPIPPYLLN